MLKRRAVGAPTNIQIAEQGHFIGLMNGQRLGDSLADWYQAEVELKCDMQ